MNDAQLLERLHRADAYGAGTAMPETIWPADRALQEIERRMAMTDQTTHQEHTDGATTRPQPPRPSDPQRMRPSTEGRRRGILVGLAAAAVVLIVAATVMVLRDDSGAPVGPGPETTTTVPAPTTTQATVPPSTTTTTAPTTTTAAPGISEAEAAATAEAFLNAYNSGDPDAVTSLLAPGALVGFRFDGTTDYMDAVEWEWRLVWNLAQGTELAPWECSQQVAAPGDMTRVVACDTANVDAVTQVAGLPGVTTTVVFAVGADGIVEVVEQFSGDFGAGRGRFEVWMDSQHPGVLKEIDIGAAESREEAATDGAQLAEYASEWGAFLVANDCDPKLLCNGI